MWHTSYNCFFTLSPPVREPLVLAGLCSHSVRSASDTANKGDFISNIDIDMDTHCSYIVV
jgi:hypothetical protein